jgi:hypothetical protein
VTFDEKLTLLSIVTLPPTGKSPVREIFPG